VSKRDSFLLRLNPETLRALRQWSEDEYRSMNSQIEMVLVKALIQAGRLPKPRSGESGACDDHRSDEPPHG